MKSLFLYCSDIHTSNAPLFEAVDAYLGLPDYYDAAFIMVNPSYVVGRPKQSTQTFSRIFLKPDPRTAHTRPQETELMILKMLLKKGERA